MNDNFAALWHTGPILAVLKDLNLLKKYTKNQEDGYNFKLDFTLSNRPYLHRAYLVTVHRLIKAIVVLFTFSEQNIYF